MTLCIDLPWPDRALHPNSRVHWSVKAKAAKRARQDAGWAAKAAGVRRIDAPSLVVTVAFSAPDNRRRDADGVLTASKAALDGIADVIGVDDSRWSIAMRRDEPKAPGSVRIEIEVPA